MLLGDDCMYVLVKDNALSHARIESAQKCLSDANDRLISLMTELGIEKLGMASYGNSIATGFSYNDSIIPLLKRNEDLIKKCEEMGIKLELFAYSRAQDNADVHAGRKIIKNTTQEENNAYVRKDYLSEQEGMFAGYYKRKNEIKDILAGKIDKSKFVRTVKKFLNINKPPRALKQEERTALEQELSRLNKKIERIKETTEKYYPEKVEDDKGARDFIDQKGVELANIIVYNPYTGSFLDNWTRNGENKDITKSFVPDENDIDRNLANIFQANPHTQVYVCGMPYLLKTKLSNLRNKKLKEICSKYPNCIYVEPVPQNLLYRDKDGDFCVDIHYSDDEYLNLLTNVVNSIADNYEFLKAYAEFISFFDELHDKNNKNQIYEELRAQYGDITNEFKNEYIFNTSDEFLNDFFSKHHFTSEQLKEILNYFKVKYCTLFHQYIPKFKDSVVQRSFEQTVEPAKSKK